MNHFIISAIVFLGLSRCSDSSSDYRYIKVMSIADADSVTMLNKGKKVYNYLYFDPSNNQVIFRFVQPGNTDSFLTYKGSFENKAYADTIELLISYLKSQRHGLIPTKLNTADTYSGPLLLTEFLDSSGIHHHGFAEDRKTFEYFSRFFHRLEVLPWKKEIVSNETIDETLEAVKVLKGVGLYDDIQMPYVPLKCEQGIEMDKLYGTWRTIGDEFDDTSERYFLNIIDSSGTWITDRILYGEKKRIYLGKIQSINENVIVVESETGVVSLEILTLNDNCFEYKYKEKTFRLDRSR